MNPASAFKDLFSGQSTDYAKYRPVYPEALFQYLSSIVNEHQLAWDCATGNGQAAVQLTTFFDKVIATDASAKQIAAAEQHPKIEYLVEPAEKTSFNNQSVDLITAAQSFHWFRQYEFFDEVHRVLKPGGVLAFWCYGLAQITPDVDAVVMKFYRDILGDYWEEERRLVEEGYRNVFLPMKAISSPPFEMRAEWTFDHLLGYLGTWSALQTYIQKKQTNPLENLLEAFTSAWGSEKKRLVKWELALRIGRK